MRRSSTTSIVIFALTAACAMAAAQGCGSGSDSSVFPSQSNGDDGGGRDGSGEPQLLPPDVFGDGGLADSAQCVNLQCNQVTCSGGGKTTVTGTVYDPAGANPLYNAIVYVPNGKVEAFKPGVTCDQCGAVASGSPLVSALTDATGKFTLENVPVGSDIPLVIQIGRWRRQITIPSVAACTETKLTDKTQTRLPKNKAEGDIPLMAISTGQADPFECLLLKMGIDAAEFTTSTGTGRVHYFHENGVDLGGGAPPGSDLWSQAATLKNYDLVLLPCEGGPNAHTAGQNNLLEYTNVGGRVFTTHYSYAWTQAIWPSTGAWDLDQMYLDDITSTIDVSFPKGKAFADWLQNVGATTTYGKLAEHEARHDLDKVNAPPSQQWISIDGLQVGASANKRTTKAATSVQHMTFNTPINAGVDDAGNPLQCGKVVYSDFHVSASALDPNQKFFPATCKSGPLSDQEKALEFMIFDLSACIQKEDAPPAPPPPPTVR
jgi:hypothetical protein